MRENTTTPQIRFHELEGHRVALLLADGSHLDNVSVISAGRGRVSSVWLDRDGIDVFVRKTDIVEARDLPTSRAA
jgi:hypothetical protein